MTAPLPRLSLYLVTALLIGTANLSASEPRKGDFDADGSLTTADIDLLGTQVARGGYDHTFDLSRDGLVDRDDVGTFLILANRINGDADFNGHVQFLDFAILAKNFGGVAKWSTGDFDTNGHVQFPDFAILAGNFGASSVVFTQPVPEPHGIALAALGAMSFLAIHRHRTRLARRGDAWHSTWRAIAPMQPRTRPATPLREV